MLEIKNIKKSYVTGSFKQKALDDVSIKFRENEFVAILGPSGSGKTTLLNILGGLDHYDQGDLIINGKSTKKFKDRDWDAYRNVSVGFIFQSYNLIGHISVLANVEMALKLANIKSSVRKKRAIEALTKVGLKDHMHKKPNELSGGQMQRVAIARSLVNDPDIILADEPTGALDSKTSVQIMDLIKEISKDKLVIMVTHNEDLANEYSNRIISLKDGKLITDSNPLKEKEKINETYKLNKTKMSFKEALALSVTNIMTKKGRTLLTAFASSIGIIGIALILSLSNGFDKQIDKYEQGIMSAMPIIVSNQAMNLDEETMAELMGESNEEFPDYDYVIPSKNQMDLMTRENKITKEYIDYLKSMPKEYTYGLMYSRYTKVNFVQKYGDSYEMPDTSGSSMTMQVLSMPESLDDNKMALMDAYYDVLSGHLPKDKSEMVVMVDANNRVDEGVLKLLGLDTTKDEIKFDEIIGTTIKVAFNDDLYKQTNGMFSINDNYKELYDNGYTLTVSGIVRMKEDFPSFVQSSGLAYTEEFMQYLISKNSNSNIVKIQEKLNINLMTGMTFNEDDTSSMTAMTKENMLAYFGADSVPMAVYIYPKDFDSKDKLLDYLDDYNKDKSEADKILYTDQAEMISSMSGSIMSAITIVLVAFSSISLIVSSIMIGIITYISVLERTKEIGILRALGARKKDITRVFNAETFIIGITSGVLGILIALLLTIPVNQIIYSLTDLKGVAVLSPVHAIILIIISMTLTLIGGFIPSKIASKKDPVIALRTE